LISRKIFLVLVPHRDVRLVFRKYSADLFKAGCPGAYHFPWAAPLAALSRPLNSDELKHIAFSLGEAAGSGKINTGKGALIAFPPDSASFLFGPRIDIDGLSNALNEAAGKVTEIFPHQVIGSCLLSAAEAENAALPAPPELSFRAAAVANMFWQPLRAGGCYDAGFKWKIGNIRWLRTINREQ